MPQFSALPIEIVLEILYLAIYSTSNHHPTHLLLVNTSFYRICQPLLHQEIRLSSLLQLQKFIATDFRFTCIPRSFVLELAGGVSDPNYQLHVFLRDALVKCNSSVEHIESRSEDDGSGLSLELLRLQLNSHTRDPNLHLLHDACCSVNPKSFVWTGPDPPHHFSIAIVSKATFLLLHAMEKWTHLQHLKLTNIEFPLRFQIDIRPDRPLLPYLPSLQTIYIGRATHLRPSAVFVMIASLPLDSPLEGIRLVDTYKESIWGARVRKSDIESLVAGVEDQDSVVLAERIRRLVICEAQTERIMGGDREIVSHSSYN